MFRLCLWTQTFLVDLQQTKIIKIRPKNQKPKMTEILSETNKILKALTSHWVTCPPPSSPQNPLVLIQQQLDEVRKQKTLVVREPRPETSGFSSADAWYGARLNSSMVVSAEASDSGEVGLAIRLGRLLQMRSEKGQASRGVASHGRGTEHLPDSGWKSTARSPPWDSWCRFFDAASVRAHASWW